MRGDEQGEGGHRDEATRKLPSSTGSLRGALGDGERADQPPTSAARQRPPREPDDAGDRQPLQHAVRPEVLAQPGHVRAEGVPRRVATAKRSRVAWRSDERQRLPRRGTAPDRATANASRGRRGRARAAARRGSRPRRPRARRGRAWTSSGPRERRRDHHGRRRPRPSPVERPVARGPGRRQRDVSAEAAGERQRHQHELEPGAPSAPPSASPIE